MTLIGMVLAAAAARFVPHPPNLTPVTAMAIFGGAYFSDKRLAFAVPLLAMFLSDLVLGFHSTLPVVYGCLAFSVCLGIWIRRRKTFLSIMGAAFAGSAIFFILTNFAVWALQSLYPKTAAGLMACYLAAMPFFRNTLLSDLGYTLAMFGGFWLAERTFPLLKESPA